MEERDAHGPPFFARGSWRAYETVEERDRAEALLDELHRRDFDRFLLAMTSPEHAPS